MEVTLSTKADGEIKKAAYKKHLQKLADNITLENLAFLAELSEKKGVNESLVKNKSKIKFFL